jgi:acyl-CoA hydrolase
VVIVEATAITEDGGIIPGASVGASPELIQMADKVRELQLLYGTIADEIVTDYCRSEHVYALI